MGSSPITPITPNVNGLPVLIWNSVTSTAATTVHSVDLPSYAPKIDIRIGHPVLAMCFVTNETNVTGTEAFLPQNEMPRGTAPDSTGEWEVIDIDTVEIYKTADQDGILFLNYIAYGAQLA